jgi:hypothetical protein
VCVCVYVCVCVRILWGCVCLFVAHRKTAGGAGTVANFYSVYTRTHSSSSMNHYYEAHMKQNVA